MKTLIPATRPSAGRGRIPVKGAKALAGRHSAEVVASRRALYRGRSTPNWFLDRTRLGCTLATP
jgi:hypothetical protein